MKLCISIFFIFLGGMLIGISLGRMSCSKLVEEQRQELIELGEDNLKDREEIMSLKKDLDHYKRVVLLKIAEAGAYKHKIDLLELKPNPPEV